MSTETDHTTTQKIPTGTYKGKAVPETLQYGFTSNNNEQAIVDIDLYGIEGDHVGRVSCPMVFTDKSATFQQDRLRALGWDGSSNADLPGLGSTEAEVAISYEMYEGKEQMRVNVVTGAGGIRIPEERKFSPDQRRKFAATFLAVAGGQRSGAPLKNGPAPTVAAGARPKF